MRKLACLFLWLCASVPLYAASDSVQWHPLPEGYRSQTADMMALTASDFRLAVGAVNGQRDVILNITSSTGKEGPLVYRYTPGEEGQAVRRLKSARADRQRCTRALTVADTLPVASEKMGGFLLAGVSSPYDTDMQLCDMSGISPVIWQNGRWRTLEQGAPFDTDPDRTILVPVRFSSDSAHWLLGKEVLKKRQGGKHRGEMKSLVVWRYDSGSAHYVAHQQLQPPAGYQITEIVQFLEDGKYIVLNVRQETPCRSTPLNILLFYEYQNSTMQTEFFPLTRCDCSQDPDAPEFSLVYTLENGVYQQHFAQDYPHKAIGYDASLNRVLVSEQLDEGGGAALYLDSYNLSASGEVLFKAPPLGNNRINLAGSGGQLMTSLVTGFGGNGATVYQQGVTRDQTGTDAFVSLPVYLTRSCRLSGPPLSTCSQRDLKLTAVHGTTAYGDCFNERYQTRAEGFLQVDLSACPDGVSQTQEVNGETDRSMAPGVVDMGADNSL